MTDKWEDIETAPRDRTWFLGYSPNEGINTIRFHSITGITGITVENWECVRNYHGLDSFTHWQPLPEPPQNKDK